LVGFVVLRVTSSVTTAMNVARRVKEYIYRRDKEKVSPREEDGVPPKEPVKFEYIPISSISSVHVL